MLKACKVILIGKLCVFSSPFYGPYVFKKTGEANASYFLDKYSSLSNMLLLNITISIYTQLSK